MTREPIISLGAGVQSSALLLLAGAGEIAGPEPELAVFADTHHETPATYRWLERLEAESSIPIERTTAGDLLEAAVNDDYNPIPLHTTNEDGSPSMGRKQCTYQFKIRPIRALLRRRGYGPKRPVEMLMGISTNEIERVKSSNVLWAENAYPLIELGMSRADCARYVHDLLGAEPPNSACHFCPLVGDGRRLQIRRQDPETFERMIEADEAMRIGRNGRRQYVSGSMIPLAELADAADRQPALFAAECEGYCGV